MQILSQLDLLHTPLALLVLPLIVSALVRSVVTVVTVASIVLVGGIGAATMPPGHEQWSLVGALVAVGMILSVQGHHARRTAQSIRRLEDGLAEMHVATSSLRNAFDQERHRHLTGAKSAETGR